MYGGGKLEGGIVGRIQAEGDAFEEEDLDMEDLLNSTPVEEAYCCRDFEGAPLALMAGLDPDSGDVVWEQHDVQTVLRRTIQMSQMVSMLHDKDRNEVYHAAIRVVIDSYVEKTGRGPVVLDVGCGTGILSCMAATTLKTNGSVVGCEMFDAMATVAGAVVKENGLENVVQIVASKSLEVELHSKADILISELLDSSLLGESVIFSHADAISRLMTHSHARHQLPPISERVVPHSATVFAVLVECPELFDTYNVEHIMPGQAESRLTPWRNEESSSCRGGRSVIPVHWCELKERSGGRELSTETPVLIFDFFHPEARDECEAVWETDIVVNEDSDGIVHGVLLYWKLHLLSEALDPERKLHYSTKPGSQNWQDHWVQCAHVLPVPLTCRKGEVFRLKVFHDNLRIWLDCSRLDRGIDAAGNKRSKSEPLQMQVSPSSSPECDPPQCQCGWHLLCSPYRILALNDSRARDLWNNAVYAMMDSIKSDGVILDVSDESILAVAVAKHYSSRPFQHDIKVVSREKKLLARLHAQQLAEANNLERILEIWDGEGTLEDALLDCSEDDEGERSSSPPPTCIVGLVSECNYYQLSSKPVWAALAFHYQRTALQPYFTPATVVLPSAARIMVVAYELQDLGVSHGLAGSVCGFDHSPLDRELLPNCASQPGTSSAWSDNWFPYKLADYAKRALTLPQCLATFDYQNPIQSFPETASVVEFMTAGRCDCIALYVDYDLDKDSSVSYLDKPYYKPNLKFFTEEEKHVEPGIHVIKTIVQFEVGDSDLSYSFRLVARE